MDNTTSLTVRIDKDTKEQAEAFFTELGMNMTTAINVFLCQTLRLGKIPFEISTQSDPFYSESNMDVLCESVKQADEGKIISKSIEELQMEQLKYLNA